MSTQDDKQRTRRERITRLRRRLENAIEPGELTFHNRLVVVIKGVLDLLEDEL